MTTQTDFSANAEEVSVFFTKQNKTDHENNIIRYGAINFDEDQNAFAAWLSADNVFLGNRRPIDIINLGNTHDVMSVVHCMSGYDCGYVI